MQRSSFIRPQIGPKEESNPSSQDWAPQSVNLNNYGDIKLYNPNEMNHINYNNNFDSYPDQSQNAWPNGDRGQVASSYQAGKPAGTLGSFNGGQEPADDANARAWDWGNQPSEQHNNTNWTPVYSTTQQDIHAHPSNIAYTHSNTAPTSDVSTFSNYDEVWNWGKEADSDQTQNYHNSNENQSDVTTHNADEQLNENYQRWNLAQHFQYDWSQGQHVDSVPNLSTLPTVLGQTPNLQWSNVPQTDTGSSNSTNWSPELVAPTDIASNLETDNATNEVESSFKMQPIINECSNINAEHQGSVSTYFHHGNDDNSGIVTLKDESGNEISDDKKICEKNLGSELGGELQRNPHFPAYLRADSWISNSSLVTYNRSFTGSQEFLLSGCLGSNEDGIPSTNRDSMTDLCNAAEDLHISPQSLRPCEIAHPLHTSFSGREGNESSIVSDQSIDCKELNKNTDADSFVEDDENLVCSDKNNASTNQIETNLEVIPVQSDNLEVLDKCEQNEPTEKGEESLSTSKIVIQKWNDDVTNEEVPSLKSKEILPKSSVDLQSVVQKEVGLAENLEVIEKPLRNSEVQQLVLESSQGLPSWSRENSAFQPVSSTNARPSLGTIVIQREVLDEVPIKDTLSISTGIKANVETESANLEMVPDNAERPVDGDLTLDSNEKESTVSALNAHSARHRQIDLKVPSPGTTLWANPDLGGNIGSVLAPPATGSNLRGPTQNAIIVPKIAAQIDNDDNSSSTAIIQTIAQRNQLIDNTLQRQMAVGGSNEGISSSITTASPLDLSSRAAPQGRSFIDDEMQRRGRLEPPVTNRDSIDDQQQIPTLTSMTSRNNDLEGRPNSGNYSGSNPEQDSHRQWRHGSREDYWRDDDRDWENRHRSRGYEDDYSRRSGARREDVVPPPQSRDYYAQGQWRRDSRDWEREQPPYDPYRRSYARPERERSRPSSRASNQDYEPDRYYERRGSYAGPEDPRGPPRPSSRSGYESDHGSERQTRPEPQYPPYNYYNRDSTNYGYGYPGQSPAYNSDPRVAGYPGQSPAYNSDPRVAGNPYYPMSSYDYGYYAELYGSDPRYRAYYDSVAKGYYWQQQQYQQRYDEYDRHSVHSGRSSVTDDSRNSQARRESKDYSADISGSSNSLSRPLNNDESALSYDDSYIQNRTYSEFAEQISSGTEILSPQRLTPAKFAIPHVRATFSPSGKMVVVLPNSIADGQSASVEICDGFINQHSNILPGNAEYTPQLNDYPGPLIRGDTHKNDVIQFCLQKIKKAKSDADLPDRESCILIWELLILLIRQNGVVVGTDIAELLLKNQNFVENEPVARSNEDTLITESNENCLPTTSSSQDTDKFLEFLLYGHKKDALEFAMKQGIWGHALFLASKMDTRTYAMVMTRFANSLTFNHPLQTLYQLMSGRQPAAVTNIADEKWGDWRPHLAIILSNSSHKPELDRRSVINLGDTLASKGCLHAAHFCYLMAQLEFGNYSKKSSKLVLIGANHSLPFSQFATEDAIQCTDIYEYVQSLANPQFILPHLQFYKFLYAIKLIDAGYPQKALHYCEVIASSIQKWPHLFDVNFACQVYDLAHRLKYYDPYYLQEEGEIADMNDPEWIRNLWNVIQSYENGTIHNSELLDQKLTSDSTDRTISSDIYGLETSTPMESPIYPVQTYSYDQNSGFDTNAQIGYQESNQSSVNKYSDVASQQQEPSPNTVPIQADYSYSNSGITNQGFIENKLANDSNYNYDSYYGAQSNFSQQTNSSNLPDSRADPENDYYSAIPSMNAHSSARIPEHRSLQRKPSNDSGSVQTSNDDQKNENKVKQLPNKNTNKSKQGGSSWLGGIFSKFSLKPKNQMILPDDKNPKIVWDPKTGRWTNMESGEEQEENHILAAPPKDLEVLGNSGIVQSNPNYDLNQTSATPTTSLPPTTTTSENRYKLRPGRGMRNNYVDVLGGNVVPVQTATNALPLMGSNLGTSNPNQPIQFLIPSPIQEIENSSVNFVSSANPLGNNELNQFEQHTTPSNQQLDNQIDDDHPVMYNPSMMQPATSTPNASSSSGLHRYGRRPR